MDLDLDSALYPLKTSEVLLWFTGVLLVHLCNFPHVVSELRNFVLIGDMGWKVYARLSRSEKEEICLFISEHGPLVFPSLASRSFIRGKCAIPLSLLVEALDYADVPQVVFYAYGMKSTSATHELANYKLPRNPIVCCRWDIGANFVFSTPGIPLFSVDTSLVDGRTYPMLLRSEGSVEIDLPTDGCSLIVYPHLVHFLKAFCSLQVVVPSKLRALRNKMETLTALIWDMKTIDEAELSNFRVEIRVHGFVTFSDALAIAQRVIPRARLPYGVRCERRIRLKDYLKAIEDVLKTIVENRIFSGRNDRPLNATQKHHLARLYNVYGYSYSKWTRYLFPPVNPTRVVVQGDVHVSVPDSSDSETDEVYATIRIRKHPKRNDLVCAINKSGGCSKAFPDARQLSKWVASHKDWKTRFQTKLGKNGGTKNACSNLLSAMRKDFEDLLVQYQYEQTTIDRKEYLLFDVPHDNQCLFHSLEGVFYPLYTSTRCPSFKAIRRAVIQFYKTCEGGLKKVLDRQFPGVMSMRRRAALLEKSPNEWGETMDIRAAACYYNINFKVASASGTGLVYIDDVFALTSDGRKSSSAKTSQRLIYFDGRNHFQVGHKLF